MNFKSVTLDIKDNETILTGTEKRVVFEFFKNSLTVMDILNQTHKIDLPIAIGEEDALLDVAFRDVISNIKGEFKPYEYQSDLFFDSKFYYKEHHADIVYVDYKDVETKEDAIHLQFYNKDVNYFYELFKVIYNNFIKYTTQFLLEVTPENKINEDMIVPIKYSMVNDFFQSKREREMYNQLSLFYDTVLHESIKDVEIIDKSTHKLLREDM